MFDQSNQESISACAKLKMPLDVRIVAWLCFIGGFMGLGVVLLLATGSMHFAADYTRPIVFGAFSIASDLSSGIHALVTGIASLVCGYGIMKGLKFGWWLTLIYSINNIGDSVLLLLSYEHDNPAIIGMCISLALIIWLVYRRRLFKIVQKAKRVET